MKALSSISKVVVLAAALIACSASSGPAGEAVGDSGGGGSAGAGNAPGSGGSGGVVPSGGVAGTNTGGTIPVSGSNTGGSAANECGVQTFNLERKPAEVLLVLDRSASMKDPVELPDGSDGEIKWSLTIPALIEVVQATNETLSWGLKVFPEDAAGEQEACSAGSVTDTIQVPIAENNAQAVVDAINATDDDGDGTPTGDAMKQAVAYLRSREGINDYNRYVLLATDGEPSCINVTETSDGDEGQDEARPYAVSAITEAASAGFRTFVVGVGTNKDTARQALNDMALAGLEPANCANPLADCFYLSNSREQLTTDLLGIATGISTCVFMLTATPPDPNNVRVTLDGDKVERDPARANGWEYQDAAQTIIEVHGQACDGIKASAAANVDIVFGCPNIDVR
jgi:Mg-chelatase subunit ChlD